MPLSFATFERNAIACETAKHPKCRCACGGKFHGQKHAQAWLRTTYASLTGSLDELELVGPPCPDWVRAGQLDWAWQLDCPHDWPCEEGCYD